MSNYEQTLAQCAAGTPYPVEAFVFVQHGLDYTVKKIHKQTLKQREALAATDPEAAAKITHHVTGRDLSLGLRDLAVQEYGLMARTVLRRWNILRSEDFGKIVFAMVEAGLMLKTEEDDLEDFSNVFDFQDAFSDVAIDLPETISSN